MELKANRPNQLDPSFLLSQLDNTFLGLILNPRVLSEPQGMRIHLLIPHAPESIYWEDIFSESREWERSKVILSFETTIWVLFTS